jgi:hypothetical protein
MRWQFACPTGIAATEAALTLCSCSDSLSPIANPTFATVHGVWTIDYDRVVTQQASPQVYDTRSFPTCSQSVPPPCVIRPAYFILDSISQGQYAIASVPPTDSTYRPLLLGSAAVANDSLILGATVINCCRTASTYHLDVYTSTMHLHRSWTMGAFEAQLYGFTVPIGAVTLGGVEDWWFRR